MLMRPLILALLVVHLAACSSMQTVAIRDVRPNTENSAVQIGDRVEVETRDDEELEFVVTDITEDGLAGQFGFVRYDDIHRLGVQRPGSGDGDTLNWILGAVGVVALIALVASADSVSACSGTPCPTPEN